MVEKNNRVEAEYLGEITPDLILDMYEKVRYLPEDQKAESLENIKLLSKNIGKLLIKT